jgi:hypothetical protein
MDTHLDPQRAQFGCACCLVDGFGGARLTAACGQPIALGCPERPLFDLPDQQGESFPSLAST